MNILIVHNHYKLRGGEDVVFEEEAKLLEKHGHKVIRYERSNCEMDDFSPFEKLKLLPGMVFSLRTYRDICRIIKEEKIEIVHVHNTVVLISPSVFHAAGKCKVPVVQTLHNYRMSCPNGLFYRDGRICEDCNRGLLHCVINKCYRNSRLQSAGIVFSIWFNRMIGTYRIPYYICLRRFQKDKLTSQAKNNGVREDKVYIKNNFIKNIVIPSTPGTDKDAVHKIKGRFVFAGRLSQEKGIESLYDYWISNYAPEKCTGNTDNKNNELFIFGDGPLMQWLEDKIKANKISSIKLMGRVSREEIIRNMSGAEATFFSSRCYEGLPITFLESYSVGTPVIIINGCPEDDRYYGEMCKSKEELSNGDIMREMSAGDGQYRYYPEGNYRRLIEIYENIVKRSQGK